MKPPRRRIHGISVRSKPGLTRGGKTGLFAAPRGEVNPEGDSNVILGAAQLGVRLRARRSPYWGCLAAVLSAACTSMHSTAGPSRESTASAPAADTSTSQLQIQPGGRVTLRGDPTLITETPDGRIVYAVASTVYVVHGQSSTRLTTGRSDVFALAADNEAAYVVTGRTVSAYSLTSGQRTERWLLPPSAASPNGVPNGAGAREADGAIFVWTDYVTEKTGSQYFDVTRIVAGRAGVDVLSRRAYPYPAASTTGLYFFTRRPGQTGNYLARVGARGAPIYTAATHPGELLAAGDRVISYSEPDQTAPHVAPWRLYDASNLHPLGHVELPSSVTSPIETANGILAVMAVHFPGGDKGFPTVEVALLKSLEDPKPLATASLLDEGGNLIGPNPYIASNGRVPPILVNLRITSD